MESQDTQEQNVLEKESRRTNLSKDGWDESFPDSKLISSIGYKEDRAHHFVRVKFCDGKEFLYSMDLGEFKTFITAESTGKYWHKFIKGNFNEKKVR